MLCYHRPQCNIPYDSLSSVHFQMNIGAPKLHLFDKQFCEGALQIFCKQRPKGLGKIPKFWPLHSVRQNIAGFRRGLFACFLGHTPLLQYYLLFGPHPEIGHTTYYNYEEPMLELLAAIWMSSENSGVQQQGVAGIDLKFKLQPVVQALVLHNCNKGCGPKSR